jgi:hypothetical protein
VVTEVGEEQLVIQGNVIGIEVLLEILDVACHMVMVGAIDLCGTKTIMAYVGLQMLSEDDDACYAGGLNVGKNRHLAGIWR